MLVIGLAELATVRCERYAGWLREILATDGERELRQVQNLGIALAKSYAAVDPTLSARTFAHLWRVEPHVTVQIGTAKHRFIADAIRDCSRRGKIVLDGFGGSGSTLIAAEKIGRAARVIEYDPLYFDTIVRRWEALTGKRAIFAGTTSAFEDVAESRLGIILDSEAAE